MKQYFTAAQRKDTLPWAHSPFGVYASIDERELRDGHGMLYAKFATLDEAQAEADRLNELHKGGRMFDLPQREIWLSSCVVAAMVFACLVRW